MKTTIKFSLPFHIRDVDGEYLCNNTKIILTTVPIKQIESFIEYSAPVVAMNDSFGAFNRTSVECAIETEQVIDCNFSTPPANVDDFYNWKDSVPEIYSYAAIALESLLSSLRVAQNLFYLPSFSPAFISDIEIEQTDTDGKITTSQHGAALLLRLGVLVQHASSGVENICRPPHPYELHLLNAKRAILEANMRQAILEVNCALESYVHTNLVAQLPENKRDSFVKKEDGKEYKSILTILGNLHDQFKYKSLSSKSFKRLTWRINKFRNDAAHGREIRFPLHYSEAVDAIHAFEELLVLTKII